MRFRSSYLDNRLHIPPNELVLVPVSTQGAEPTLMYGGVCICHTAAAVANGIWAVATKDAANAEFQRVLVRGNDGVIIYPADITSKVSYPMTIAAFKRFSIGRVVWGGRDFLINEADTNPVITALTAYAMPATTAKEEFLSAFGV